MVSFELVDLVTVQQRLKEAYVEFFRAESLSLGLYVLPAGSVDPQQPHDEDEVYYVVSGSARLTTGTEDRDVKPGTSIFVPAGLEHRFHSIEENLIILVVFVPPRGSQADGPPA